MFRRIAAATVFVALCGCTPHPTIPQSTLTIAVKNNSEAAKTLVDLRETIKQAHKARLESIAETTLSEEDKLERFEIADARYRRLFVLFRQAEQLQKRLSELLDRASQETNVEAEVFEVYTDLQKSYGKITSELSRAR